METAGDDATAVLMMILRLRGVDVAVEDVRRAIYGDRGGTPSALDLITAARTFGLVGTGWMVEDGSAMPTLRAPYVAHLLLERAAFPRTAHESRGAGRFVVVEAVGRAGFTLADPEHGRRVLPLARLLEYASGIVITFADVAPLPPARAIR